MGENPFRAAVEEGRAEREAMQAQLIHAPSEHFFQAEKDAYERHQASMSMTRQEMLENGMLRVQDMDDEELRLGRCRGKDGRIPRGAALTKMLPRDLYNEMVSEHLQRTNEKLRGQMDRALEVMVDVMGDDTVEPDIRAKTAQYLYERTAGKTPDRVNVAVAQAPWEEMIGGISRISRAESRAIRGERPIDAEVVDVVDDVVAQEEVPQYAQQGRRKHTEGFIAQQHSQARRNGPPTDGIQGGGVEGRRPNLGDKPELRTIHDPSPVEQLGIFDTALTGDPRITPAYPVPSAREPENTSATAVVEPPTNADILREKLDAQRDLAERRKAAKDKIQGAKKARIIARTMGRDAVQGNNIKLTESNGKLKFKLD